MRFDRRRFLLTAGRLVWARRRLSALRTLAADAELGPPELPGGTLEASVLEALPGQGCR